MAAALFAGENTISGPQKQMLLGAAVFLQCRFCIFGEAADTKYLVARPGYPRGWMAPSSTWNPLRVVLISRKAFSSSWVSSSFSTSHWMQFSYSR